MAPTTKKRPDVPPLPEALRAEAYVEVGDAALISGLRGAVASLLRSQPALGELPAECGDDLAAFHARSSDCFTRFPTRRALYLAAAESIVVGDVDCTVHQGLCSSNGVRGYPTIKYWKAGAESPYQGGRDFAALKKFVDDTL